MKPAKVSAPEGASVASRRAQPVRQTRTNPPRTSSLNRASSLAGGPGHEQPIQIVPAVTHFTDAIAALPKELVRHFTLLKEVDAKICAPKEDLFHLLESIFSSHAPESANHPHDASSTTSAGTAKPLSQGGNGVAVSAAISSTSSVGEQSHAAVFDPSHLPRRQRFRQAAFKIQEMLVSLEEKNHVISTANDALDKQLSRIEDVWPHLQAEFSDEAKWGSTTHWAYSENRVPKTNSTQAERSRREGAATLSAAAQQLAEEAAARSSDRKKAIAEKKGSKSHAGEAETESKPHEQPKKSQNAAKSRKTPADAGAPVGLGISANGPVNGTSSSSKRRKVENKPNGAAPMERALSSVFGGANGSKTKTASPRETPAPETSSKKRKALPTASNPSKKSRTGAAASPSVASSPVISNFPEASRPGRASPAPSTIPRPATSRARQNSVHSNVEASKPKPPAAVPSKPNGPLTATPTLKSQGQEISNSTELKVTRDPTPITKPAAAKPEVDTRPPLMEPPASTVKKETTNKVGDDGGSKKESATPAFTPTPASTVTTKSGRASKPSTPALATFAEAANAKSRPSRGTEGSTTAAKRSHKKGGSISAAAAAVAAQQAAIGESTNVRPSAAAADEEDEGDNEGDEPRYCYCNGVSYGEMVACDGLGCPREWFHLECVGLRVAPKGNAKWYCDDCRKRLKIPEKRVNGR